MKTRRESIQTMLTVAGAAGAAVAITGNAQAEQPRMEAALGSLRAALGELERADEDKGGHRARAVRLVRDAIHETEEGIRFARERR